MDELTPWQKYKKNLGDSRPWDILNPKTEYVEDEISNDRYSICKECSHFLNATKQCKLCGCFMIIKTKLEHASCPIDKW